MVKDTKKNSVFSSAGTFSQRARYHLDNTLAPICLHYFPGASKCWGGVSVFICDLPTLCSVPLERVQKETGRRCFSDRNKWFKQNCVQALPGHTSFSGLVVITFASAAECSPSISR